MTELKLPDGMGPADALRGLADDLLAPDAKLRAFVDFGREDRWDSGPLEGATHGGFLRLVADLIDRKTTRNPADDVTMSAYDLLPECDRKAISLALDCGGVEEIKKRLMPEGMEWPRFEDGEPVRFGDVVSDGDETGRVYYVTFDTVNPVIIGFTDETPDQDPGTWLEVSVNDGERVKRPAPKVLDADGVEIRVGDTVCGTRDMEPMWVVDTDSRECGFKRIKCEKEGDGFFFYCADELTHKLTVLAADGKPLREGEHVWHVETGTELVVKELPKPGAYQAVVVFAPPASYLTSFDPDQLTHERPESWERLEEDADKNPFDYCKKVGHKLDTCENAERFKARDLVRRAKKLAEAER